MHFTVIIPCFNASKTISIALNSLENQTYTNFDVVIVDDASTDYSALSAATAPYNAILKIKIIRNAVNKNGAYSRNRGIEFATGEYVAFLDADDSWVENRLALAVDLINNISDKDFVAYGQFELLQHHATGAILPLRGIRPDELVSEYVFAAGQHMQTSTFFCPLSTARKVMFDESLTRHQDSDLMMRAQRKGITILYDQKRCAYYRIKPVDIRNRVTSGRVNSTFCLGWLNTKSQFLNARATSGYKLQIYARVLYMEGNAFGAAKLVFYSALYVGWWNFLDLLKVKFLIFYKSNLGL